jgi:hypothetical protein
MQPSVRVELPRTCDAEELSAFLIEHGFDARPGTHGIEVGYARSDPLLDDVARAIAEWLATGDRDLVPVRLGGRSVTLRPPAA